MVNIEKPIVVNTWNIRGGGGIPEPEATELGLFIRLTTSQENWQQKSIPRRAVMFWVGAVPCKSLFMVHFVFSYYEVCYITIEYGYKLYRE